jgi:hypothetical protein
MRWQHFGKTVQSWKIVQIDIDYYHRSGRPNTSTTDVKETHVEREWSWKTYCGSLKEFFWGRRFRDSEEVEVAIREWLRIQDSDFYRNGFFYSRSEIGKMLQCTWGLWWRIIILPWVGELFQLTHDSGKKQKKLDKYPMLFIQFWAPDDGRRNRLKPVEHL